MKVRPLAAATSASLACALLVSCEHAPPISNERRVDTSEEVANVFVSAYPAIPWTAISDKLEPKNELSTADARAMAAVTTQSQISQFLSTFAAGLALGLPSRTQGSVTTTAADGTTTTTATRKLDPGVAPSSSGASGVAVTDSSLAADLTKSAPALGVDASTQLTVGTAVFQLAKILDNQISKSIAPKGYQAHLLTFQVNLQPKGRNLPYDAYLNLTLMPASWRKAVATSQLLASDASELAPIIVYPLVISDAMESSSIGRSVEVIRQAAIALSGVVGNIGVNAGAAGGSDRLDALLGSDRNSLVTVGRISDHTLRIRLGAQQQGSRTLALVPRTHNISVVVFTRAGDDEDHHLDKLAAITETTLVDTATGVALPSSRNSDAGRAALKFNVDSVIKDYGYQLAKKCQKDGQSSLDLLRALDRGDYGYVSDCLVNGPQETPASARPASAPFTLFGHLLSTPAQARPSSGPEFEALLVSTQSLLELAGFGESHETKTNRLTPADESRLRRVVAQLMSTQADSRFSKLFVQLSAFKSRAVLPPPVSQLAVLNDDKSSARVVLREGQNLDVGKLKSRLKVSPNGTSYDLLPTSMEVDSEGKVLTVVFPSLLGNKLMSSRPATKDAKAEEETDPPINLYVSSASTNASEIQAFAGASNTGYPVKLLRPEKNAVASPVSTSSAVLIVDASGLARVTLVIGEWDGKKHGDLGIRVSGAEVRSTEPAKVMDAKLRTIPVAGGTSVALVLGNVTAGRTVQIAAVANKEVVGEPITLAVEPARALPK